MQPFLEKAFWSTVNVTTQLLIGSMVLALLLITSPILLAVLLVDRGVFCRTFGIDKDASLPAWMVRLLTINPSRI